MSSPHGPYKLGYTRATMVKTKSCKDVNLSQSLNFNVVQIMGCNSPM